MVIQVSYCQEPYGEILAEAELEITSSKNFKQGLSHRYPPSTSEPVHSCLSFRVMAFHANQVSRMFNVSLPFSLSLSGFGHFVLIC